MRHHSHACCARVATFTSAAALTSALLSSAALANDHNNLDHGRPLRIEDAYPISHGEFVFEFGAAYVDERHSPDRFLGEGELLFGALPNFQLGLGGFGSSQPRDIDDQEKSGDLQLSGLYNFNQETLTLPAMAARATINFPTGVDSSGVDAEVMAIFTKSIDVVSFHFNAGYEFLSGTSDDQRDGRWKVALGSSIPLGAPHSTRLTLLADVFAEESIARHGDATLGAEVGLRYQLTERAVLDLGVGSEFDGDDRSPLFATLGLSLSF